MKKCIAVLLVICLLLSGCSSMFGGSYVSINPHLEEDQLDRQEFLQVRSYEGLLSALAAQIEVGAETVTLSVSGFSEEWITNSMDAAIRNITANHPLGVYAVESITYEQGTTGGVSAVAVTITYNSNRAELLRLKRAKGMEQAQSIVTAALDQCEAGVVFLVEGYEQTDFIQMIENHADAHPESVMELPAVTVSMFPQSGDDRLVELRFEYQTSRDTLRGMQTTVAPVFASARLYVSGDAPAEEKYSQLCSFLIERYQYQIETSKTPTYSLLRYGVGDSKAFAVVYASMCRQAGLECQVVSGTWAGESRFWNIICVDEVHYHLDLLRCYETGVFQTLSDSQMEGYVWDYSAYPVCGMPEPDPTEETTQE